MRYEIRKVGINGNDAPDQKVVVVDSYEKTKNIINEYNATFTNFN